MIEEKNKFTYNTKNEKGITLIALLITIVVMLILSTVTITTLTGQDSLVSSVEIQKNEVIQMNAKQEVEIAAEKIKLTYASIKLSVKDFSTQLEIKLKINDPEAIVTPKDEGYEVKYKGYTFNYYYDYIKVTLDATGGNVNPNTKLLTYDQPYGKLPTPTRTKYNFVGWYTEQNGGTKVEETTQVTLKSDHTLYAVWTVNNIEPVINSTSVYSRNTNSITIRAQATDKDNDTLIYKLYLKPQNGTYPASPNVTSNAMTSGINVDLQATGLLEYTIYNYKVEVTDGIAVITSSEGITGTGCAGTGETCTGPFYEDIVCTAVKPCTDSTTKQVECGQIDLDTATGSFSTGCSSCNVAVTKVKQYYWTCKTCGGRLVLQKM